MKTIFFYLAMSLLFFSCKKEIILYNVNLKGWLFSVNNEPLSNVPLEIKAITQRDENPTAQKLIASLKTDTAGYYDVSFTVRNVDIDHCSR